MEKLFLFIVCLLVFSHAGGQTNVSKEINKAVDHKPVLGSLPSEASHESSSQGSHLRGFQGLIGYEFKEETVVNCYRWRNKSGISADVNPVSWDFQGSTDGKIWTSLHSIRESPGVSGWSSYFKFENKRAFKYYRMQILAAESQQDVVVELQIPAEIEPQLTATLQAELTGDNNLDGEVNPGERLTYTTVINNSGVSNALQLNLELFAPAYTDLVPGSLRTSALANPDDFYSTPVNTILKGISVLENDFGLPAISVMFFGNTSFPAESRADGINTAVSDKGGVVRVNGDGTFYYLPPTGFSGQDQFAYTVSSGTLPDDAGTVTIRVVAPVKTVNDHYAITGNVHNKQDAARGLLANDKGEGNVITEVNGISGNIGQPTTTSKGGTVIVQKDGSFSYFPPAGHEGEDIFFYTANNLLNKPQEGRVELLVSGMIWFIDGTASEPGDGTLAKPFRSLADFNRINNGIGNNPAPGDNIFISSFESEYLEGVVMLDNQKLIGQGTSRNIEELTGLEIAFGSASIPPTRGAFPVISNRSGASITLAKGNTIGGVQLGNSPQAALAGNSFGTLIVCDVLINTNGQALQLADGTLNGNFSSIVSSGGLHNISLENIKTVGVCALGVDSDHLSGATGDAIRIDGSTGSFTYSGILSNNASLTVNILNKTGGFFTSSGPLNPTSYGKGISISNCSNGTKVSFDGAVKKINSEDRPGISILHNPGCSISFTGGGLDIFTSNSDGISASNGGNVSITGGNNKISSVGGIALKVVNTTIGELGLTFESISASGGSNGIVLDNTGLLAGLTITGSEAGPSSGGVLQNTYGEDGHEFGNGVYLARTSKIKLNHLDINNHPNNGIYGRSVSNLTLDGVRVSGINGSSNSPLFAESAIHLVDVGELVTVRNCHVSGGSYNNILVRNDLEARDLTALVFDSNVIDAIRDIGKDIRNVALQVLIAKGNANTKIVSNLVENWRGDAVRVTYQGTASGTAEITGNVINNSVEAPDNTGGILLSGGELSYVISYNQIRNVKHKAIGAETESFGKYMRGLIAHNTIGVSGIINSGTASGYGIYVRHCGPGTTSSKISNNIIRQIGGSDGIRVLAGDDERGGGAGILNLVVNENDIAEPGAGSNYSIFILCGMTATDTDRMCLDLKDNRAKNYPLSVKQMKLTSVALAGYTGNPTNISQISRYLVTSNNNMQVTVGSSGTYSGLADCPQ